MINESWYNTKHEKAAIKAGKLARRIWRGKPNKPEEQHAQKPHPSPQTEGKVDAQEHGTRQRGEVSDPDLRSSRSCASEDRYDLRITPLGRAEASNLNLKFGSLPFDRSV